MDWRDLAGSLKLFRHISVFIIFLMVLGIMFVIWGYSNLFSGFLIFFLSVFINYIKTAGLLILWVDKKYKIKNGMITDFIITIIIAGLFGYKYAGLFNHPVLALIIYTVMWVLCLRHVYLFSKKMEGFLNKKRRRNIL